MARLTAGGDMRSLRAAAARSAVSATATKTWLVFFRTLHRYSVQWNSYLHF